MSICSIQFCCTNNYILLYWISLFFLYLVCILIQLNLFIGLIHFTSYSHSFYRFYFILYLTCVSTLDSFNIASVCNLNFTVWKFWPPPPSSMPHFTMWAHWCLHYFAFLLFILVWFDHFFCAFHQYIPNWNCLTSEQTTTCSLHWLMAFRFRLWAFVQIRIVPTVKGQSMFHHHPHPSSYYDNYFPLLNDAVLPLLFNFFAHFR